MIFLMMFSVILLLPITDDTNLYSKFRSLLIFDGSLSWPLKWNLSLKTLYDGLGNSVLKLNVLLSITQITPALLM